ncbi:MAG: NTP transferase domain-containing protein [Methanoregulaceae archaeon]|jgi:adenosylcobinamide-phosphate guanylyltransferase|nr:NTP transferase domain-containing protein [Methanoregulaceae archaeon]
MLALIMAGGAGTRLNLGEKPLVQICGQPMIEYIIHAFERADSEVIVIVSPGTPYTANWCRAHRISLITADGIGYIPDLIQAVEETGERNPLFTSVSDLPCLTPGTVAQIRRAYEHSGKDACSTWVPKRLCDQSGCRTTCVEEIEGEPASPAGINILRGNRIHDEQDELKLLMHQKELIFNINTREELMHAEQFLRNQSRR